MIAFNRYTVAAWWLITDGDEFPAGISGFYNGIIKIGDDAEKLYKLVLS